MLLPPPGGACARRHIPKMLLPRLLLASGLSQSCVNVTLARLDTLGETADNAGEREREREK